MHFLDEYYVEYCDRGWSLVGGEKAYYCGSKTLEEAIKKMVDFCSTTKLPGRVVQKEFNPEPSKRPFIRNKEIYKCYCPECGLLDMEQV